MATKALGHPFTIDKLYKLLLANSGWIMVEFYDVSQTLYKARPQVTWFMVPEKKCVSCVPVKNQCILEICENPHKISISRNFFGPNSKPCIGICKARTPKGRVSRGLAVQLPLHFGYCFCRDFLNRHSMCRTFKL